MELSFTSIISMVGIGAISVAIIGWRYERKRRKKAESLADSLANKLEKTARTLEVINEYQRKKDGISRDSSLSKVEEAKNEKDIKDIGDSLVGDWNSGLPDSGEPPAESALSPSPAS